MPDPASHTTALGLLVGSMVTVAHSFVPFFAPAVWGGLGGLTAVAMMPHDPPHTLRTGTLRVLASAALAAMATRGIMSLFGWESDDVLTLVAGFLGIAAPVIVQWVMRDGWTWALDVFRKMIGGGNG